MSRTAAACAAGLLLATTLQAQEAPRALSGGAGRGVSLYRAHCGRCHGLQGLGGTGPSLARPVLRHARDEAALADVIVGGITGTGMPGNWMLSPDEVRLVARFVLSLGRSADDEPTGDAAAGRQVYRDGQCGTCHIVAGDGASVGPELTRIGARRGPGFLRAAISHPGLQAPRDAFGYLEYLVVRVVDARGQEITGRRVNEDSFTIQLRDLQNRHHSFRKAELRELHREEGASLMPSFEGAFSAEQLDDLVAYLSGLGRQP